MVVTRITSPPAGPVAEPIFLSLLSGRRSGFQSPKRRAGGALPGGWRERLALSSVPVNESPVFGSEPGCCFGCGHCLSSLCGVWWWLEGWSLFMFIVYRITLWLSTVLDINSCKIL